MTRTRKLLLIGLLVLAAGIAAVTVLRPKVTTDRAATIKIKETKDGQQFTNRVDGYRIMLPRDAKVEFDEGQLRTHILLGEGRTLDIYNTPDIPEGSESDYYLKVSTGAEGIPATPFLNTADHKILMREEGTTAGFRSFRVMWDRTPLTTLPDDRSHYYSIDMALTEDAALSFLYKDAQPVTETAKNEIDTIVDSFTRVKPTATAVYEADSTPGRSDDELAPQTLAVREKYFSPDAPLHWGIFEPSYAAFEYGKLKELEADLGTTFRMVIQYMDITRSDPDEHIAPILYQAVAEGRSVELTFQTINPMEGPNQVYEIINGKHDAYLKRLSEVIRESGATVLLRIGNEMNGDWCQYSPVLLSRDPDMFVAFYRYLVDFFERDGASKQMLYVWNPNSESFPDYRWNNPHLTWPGNRYVDLVGLTAYNTGTYYGFEKWLTFDELYRKPYEEYKAMYKQPLMITEFASSSVGGDKEAWIRDMLHRLETDYKDIKVAIWWNHADYDPKDLQTISRPYFINQPEEAANAFREYFQTHNK